MARGRTGVLWLLREWRGSRGAVLLAVGMAAHPGCEVARATAGSRHRNSVAGWSWGWPLSQGRQALWVTQKFHSGMGLGLGKLPSHSEGG